MCELLLIFNRQIKKNRGIRANNNNFCKLVSYSQRKNTKQNSLLVIKKYSQLFQLKKVPIKKPTEKKLIFSAYF
jgi:hypothetical protein